MKKPAIPDAKTTKRAVVDIGSNSVRLVVYDGPARAPFVILNEKALCGLGRAMSDQGALNPNSVAETITTLKRFRRLLREHDAPPVKVIATAAVREATDGDKFVAKVKTLGFQVSVVSGAEEAELAALGVVSFEPGATGIVGDMGGGSLELISVQEGRAQDNASLSIGPLNLMKQVGGDLTKARQIIEDNLDEAPFLNDNSLSALYAVGGAWRAIARIHMNLRNYPLSILHHYEMTKGQATEICDLLAQQSRKSLEEIPGIPKRRLDTLPFAAIALKSVLRRMNAKKLIVSAGGVREGLLYRDLSDKEKISDPLLSACQFYADRLSPDPEFGPFSFKVLKPLFAQYSPASLRLAEAACLLIDIAAYFHPDLRGRQAFDAALSAPFAAVSHQDRIWIALALFARHEGRSVPVDHEHIVSLLSWDEQQSAMQFGMGLRFVAAFAPKAHGLLQNCRLVLEGDQLIFHAPKNRQELMGETPRRRFEALANVFNASAVERYGV